MDLMKTSRLGSLLLLVLLTGCWDDAEKQATPLSAQSQEPPPSAPQVIPQQMSVAAQESSVAVEEHIKQANELLKQRRTDEAIASIKAAIATNPMSNRPWRALQQITEKASSAEEALKPWNDLKTLYPSNPFYLLYHALIFKERAQIEIGEYGAEIQKAKTLAPTNPFVLFYSVQALVEMGQYDAALQDINAYRQTGGNEEVNDAISFYECLTLAVNRQFRGADLPQSTWAAPTKYEIDVSISGVTKPTAIQPWLVQLCGTNLKTKSFIFGGDTGPGFEPKRWKFAGSEVDPFPYAPGLFIWDGSVIAVPTYGTFIVNGTHVKHVQTKNGVTKTRIGKVKDWTFVFEN